MKSVHDLIEALFGTHGTTDKSGNSVLEAQVTFKLGGGAVSGTIRRGPVEGSYALCTPQLDRRTGNPIGVVDVYFFPDEVQHVDIKLDSGPSMIKVPEGALGGNLVLP